MSRLLPDTDLVEVPSPQGEVPLDLVVVWETLGYFIFHGLFLTQSSQMSFLSDEWPSLYPTPAALCSIKAK